MSIIYFLIGCSILLALIFLGAFFGRSAAVKMTISARHPCAYCSMMRMRTSLNQESDSNHLFSQQASFCSQP